MMDEEKLNDLPEGDDEEYEEVDLLTLTDEEGVEHEFEIADRLALDGGRYLALIPEPQSADEMLAEDGQLVVMKYCEDDDECLSLIEDDDEYYRVSAMFEERLSELYDFEDESEN